MFSLSGGRHMPHGTVMLRELEVPNDMARAERLENISNARSLRVDESSKHEFTANIDGNKNNELTIFSIFGPPRPRPMPSSRLEESGQIIQNNEFQGPISQVFNWPLHNGTLGPPPQVVQSPSCHGLQSFPSQGFQPSTHHGVQPQQVIQAPPHSQFDGQYSQVFQHPHQDPHSQGFRHPQYNDFQGQAPQIYKSPYPCRSHSPPPHGFRQPQHNEFQGQTSQKLEDPRQGPPSQGLRYPQHTEFYGQASQSFESPYHGPLPQSFRHPRHTEFQEQASQIFQNPHQRASPQKLWSLQSNSHNRNDIARAQAQAQAQGLDSAFAIRNQPFVHQAPPHQHTRTPQQYGYEHNTSPFFQDRHLHGKHIPIVAPREPEFQPIESDDEDIYGRRMKRVKCVKHVNHQMQRPISISSEENIEPYRKANIDVQNTVALSNAGGTTFKNEVAFARKTGVPHTSHLAPPLNRSANSNGNSNATMAHEALILDSGANANEPANIVDRMDVQTAVGTHSYSDEDLFMNFTENVWSSAGTSNSEVAALASSSPPTLTSKTSSTATVPPAARIDSSAQESIMLNPEFAGTDPIWCPADIESNELEALYTQYQYKDDVRMAAERLHYFLPSETLPYEPEGQSFEADLQADLNEDSYLEMQPTSMARSNDN